MSSKITLHFLQASRSIRTAWQLHLLGLDYNLKFSERENGVAPAEFKKNAGGLGKFPTLEDDGELYYESSNICEYLCDKYDTKHTLLPAPGTPERYKVLQWVHAAEGTFMLHGLAVLYTRWFQKTGDVAQTEEGMNKNVGKDMDYLESELKKSSGGGRFLLGRQEPSAADIMMHFAAAFILARGLAPKDQSWPNVEAWIKACEENQAYKDAVKKTGHKM